MGLGDANIDLLEGRSRGLRVTLSVIDGDKSLVLALEEGLAAYLFEARVQTR